MDFGLMKSKTVDLSDDLSKIKDLLAKSPYDSTPNVVSLLGMAGIGKTTLALSIFEDPSTLSDYKYRAFVKVGPKFKFKEILLCILAQIDDQFDGLETRQDRELCRLLRLLLDDMKYLIVLDDIWTPEYWDKFKEIIPSGCAGSRVLVTTRLLEVARCPKDSGEIYEIRFLNKEESWKLLCEKTFGEDESCPYELEKVGREIAEICDGLPLTIVTVARLLSKVDKTLECWKKITKKENSIFRDAYDEISKVVYPSFKYLPQYLKACFLYMGIFPQYCEIPVSKLIKLWIVEGLIDFHLAPRSWFESSQCRGTVEDFAKNVYLVELASNSLILVHKPSIYGRGIKICRLHSAIWNFCMREAEKEKLFHILHGYAKIDAEDTKNHQRLCVQNNVLFSMKDVYGITESISTIRSLLCTGSYHQYPVPICFRLRLLKVLDALMIRFYEFPNEVVQLIRLRYLALTSDGELHAAISKLWSLEYLIVHRHTNIKSSKAHSDLPVAIWDMQELKHLEVMGSDLQEPYLHSGAHLPNLSTLLGVSPRSCVKEVLERIPNLKKLGIQIIIAPDDDDANKPSNCSSDSIECYKLESLKYVVMNPHVTSQLVAFPIFKYCSLRKLTLSGLRYPWERLRTLTDLSDLDVLKLQCYAFCGAKWETHNNEFFNLRYLLLEDADLVHWIGESQCFPNIRHLIIRHCYKLKEIAVGILEKYWTLEKMELVDCPLAEASIKEIQEKLSEHTPLQISVKSSWEDGKHEP